MFVVHRNVLVAHALQALLGQADDLIVVGTAQAFAELLSTISDVDTAVVLVDILVLSRCADQEIESASLASPGVKLIALVPPAGQDFIVPALRTGVAGFIAKDVEPEMLFEGIRGVSRGEFVVSPSLSNDIAQSLRSASKRVEKLTRFLANDPDLLTPREFSVVRLLASGLSNAEIGSQLYLSEAAIKASLRRVMRKWGVRDRVQVLIKAVQDGVVEL